jgi:hypothetical protein
VQAQTREALVYNKLNPGQATGLITRSWSQTRDDADHSAFASCCNHFKPRIRHSFQHKLPVWPGRGQHCALFHCSWHLQFLALPSPSGTDIVVSFSPVQPVVNAIFFLPEEHTWTAPLDTTKPVAILAARRISYLEKTLRINATALDLMVAKDRAMWLNFTTLMREQYNDDKCAQVYLNAHSKWQTCCYLYRADSTSFSFCAASWLLGVRSPGRLPMRGIDYWYNATISSGWSFKAPKLGKKERGKTFVDRMKHLVGRQAARGVLIETPVYKVDLFDGAPAGKCSRAELEYACFSMCCDSAYSTVCMTPS